jgi:hypothetical protein
MSQDNVSHYSPIQLAVALLLAAAMVFIGFHPAQADPPSNDNWEGAIEITALPYTAEQDTTQAGYGADEPIPSCRGYSTPGNSVWYKYTPVSAMRILANTSVSHYSTLLAVYTHSDAGFAEVDCRGGNSADFTASTGETYYFQISALPGYYPQPIPGGWLHLEVKELVPPANDNFAAAESITELPLFVSADITLATHEWWSEPIPSCSWYGIYQTVWYKLTAPASGLLQAYAMGMTFPAVVAIYSGDELENLTEKGCGSGNGVSLTIHSGEVYYIQVGSAYSGVTGSFTLDLSFQPAPENDDFANALTAGTLPFSYSGNTSGATPQDGEPPASCAYSVALHTVWFSYTPTESRSVMLSLSNYFNDNYLAVFTGNDLASLSEVLCRNYVQYNPLAFYAEAGNTYYFQLGSLYDWSYGSYTLDLNFTPPPSAGIWSSPSDPTIYDLVNFASNSYDPVYMGFTDFWWNFGDGTTTTGNNVTHQFAADGDYTVWHKVQTTDQRTAETTQVIQVRTHDVGIAKFNVPQSARSGQTRTITVGLSNKLYPEDVVAELWKSSPGGYVFVGRLQQSVPVRPGNRTTEFSFNYTFTPADAAQGSVTFKAFAYLQGYRDALPGDNEVNAPPTRVGR